MSKIQTCRDLRKSHLGHCFPNWSQGSEKSHWEFHVKRVPGCAGNLPICSQINVLLSLCPVLYYKRLFLANDISQAPSLISLWFDLANEGKGGR